jgi:recombinational DNA repair ATPase RecF
MTKIIDGKLISQEVKEQLKLKVADFEKKHGRKISLAVVLVGENPASQVYVRNKIIATEYVGMRSLSYYLPTDATEEMVKETIPIWDEELTKYASKIIFERNKFILTLSPKAQEKHAFLSGDLENLVINTESGYSGTEEEIKNTLKKDLKSALMKDLKLGFTTVGPHRDDLKFTLNGIDLKAYGSQGQQRTTALSLKLAEAAIFNERLNE